MSLSSARSVRRRDGGSAGAPTRSRPGAHLFRAMRPRQWLKNGLVGAAPFAAGSLFKAGTAWAVLLTFISFCLMSSAGYLVNDLLDAASDRNHPVKRLRPIAAGLVSPRTAVVTAAVLASAALAVGAGGVSPAIGLVLLVYLAITMSYSLGVKRQAVFDLAFVSAGFVVRAVAGGLAAGVVLSQWFLVVASFGSLFMVTGKRYADVRTADASGQQVRGVALYSASYLRFVWGLAATSVILGYSLWAFDVGRVHGHSSLAAELSVVPFVLAVLRYAADIDRGETSAPEEVVLRDRGLLLLVLVWLIVFGIAARAF